MSDYILIMIQKKSTFTGHRSPQHFKPGLAVHFGLGWASAHKLDRRFGQCAHGGGDELERPVQKDTVGYSGLGDFFDFQEGRNAGTPGLVRETTPDGDL